MKQLRILAIGAATLLMLSFACAQEIRGVWCSRFQWANETPATAQGNINTVVSNMTTGHFNTLFFQIRGQCDTLFPSPEEPWSPLISNPDGANPGWDPLQFAVNAAHSNNLKIHGYFNTHTLWGSATAPNIANYPTHTYYQHGNPSDPAHRDWLIYDSASAPTGYDGSEYFWLNPGIPDADAHVRRQAAYVVSTYDVDGLHFDRVRMPAIGWGRNPIAVARWDNAGTPTPNDGPGNPEQLDWDAYMRDCVTRQVMNICGQCWGIKNWVVMSSSPLGLWEYSTYYQGLGGYSSGFQWGYRRGQDAKDWMLKGAQDFIVPQIYWANGGTKPDFTEVYTDWLAGANAAGRYLVPGSNMSNGHAELESHVLYARANGAVGHNIWHSGSALYSSWSAAGHPYETATPPVPTFPWRSTEGVITGHVFQDSCATAPAVDAWITRDGLTTWTALSSGDGFFSFLRVPPGTYSINVTYPTFGSMTIPNVVVTAGQATNIEVVPPPVTLPAPNNLSANAVSTSISLSWSDNSTSESGYEIWRGTSPGGPYTIVTTTTVNATSFTDSPTTAGTYYYVIRAVSGCQSSSYASEASTAVTAPPAPTNLIATITAGQTSVTLSWTDNSTNEISYELYRATDPGGPFTLLRTLTPNSVTYVDDAVLYVTDTTWNGSFYYRLRAINNLGPGAYSSNAIAALTWIPDLIMESRSWTGGAASAYTDVSVGAGTWANTAAKSLVTNPSVRATGGRFTGNNSLGNYAVFTPNILVHANYEILVTGPNPTIGPNAGSPGTSITVYQGAAVVDSRTYDNSRTNSALADKWLQLGPTPLIGEFPLGTGRTIRLINNNPSSANTGQRFNIDAIRLRFVSFTPITVSRWSVE